MTDLGGVPGLRKQARSRLTQTIVSIYLAEPAGIDTTPGDEWAVVCEDHGSILSRATRMAAVFIAPDPSEWCENCRLGRRGGTPELRRRVRKLMRRHGPWEESELRPDGLPTIEAAETKGTIESSVERKAFALLLSRIHALEIGEPDPALPDPRQTNGGE